MQVYVWARRHQYVTLSFLGIFTFTAPYLPWVLLAFSIVLRSSPVVDLMGMLAGILSPTTSICAMHDRFVPCCWYVVNMCTVRLTCAVAITVQCRLR